MSLKAKIEAVIYASEEPVTLVQLVGLLGEEAQLELDALEAQQPTLDLAVEGEAPAQDLDPDALNAETIVEEASEDAPAAADSAESVSTEVSAAEESAPTEAAAANAPSEKILAAEAKIRERKLRTYFREVLDQLIAEYANNDRGFEVREIAGGFRFATKPEYHDAVRGFVKSLKPPLKLSLQALETLAVIAYKQPITAPEVSEIRGVDSGGVIGSLITRKLVQTAGRKQVIGRPMLYKSSKEFLVRFGLKDINELPSIEEFEKMAGELAEAVQEEMQMDEPNTNEETAPAAVDELNSAPEPTQHESVEEALEDKGKVDGADEETREAAEEVEPNAEVHEAQADGEPEA